MENKCVSKDYLNSRCPKNRRPQADIDFDLPSEEEASFNRKIPCLSYSYETVNVVSEEHSISNSQINQSTTSSPSIPFKSHRVQDVGFDLTSEK